MTTLSTIIQRRGSTRQLDATAMTLFFVRLTVALLLAVHGWYRLLSGGVLPFGEWLNSQGFPFGLVIAALVTATEIIGSIALILNRWVWIFSACLALNLICGIFLVHAREGWFVVGAGRNGMEFSVLLVVTLLSLGWNDWMAGRKKHP